MKSENGYVASGSLMIREVVCDWELNPKKAWENQRGQGEQATPSSILWYLTIVLSRHQTNCFSGTIQQQKDHVISEGQLSGVKEDNFMNVKHTVADKDCVCLATPLWIN